MFEAQILILLRTGPLADALFSYISNQRNPRFTGREDIMDEIKIHFMNNEGNAFILRGMGGIG